MSAPMQGTKSIQLPASSGQVFGQSGASFGGVNVCVLVISAVGSGTLVLYDNTTNSGPVVAAVTSTQGIGVYQIQVMPQTGVYAQFTGAWAGTLWVNSA